MADKKNPEFDDDVSAAADIAWAAGALSFFGSYTRVVAAGTAAVKLTVKATGKAGAVTRLAAIAGTRMTQGKDGVPSMTLTGAPLHRFMTMIWDELSIDAKKKYAAVRKAVKVENGG